MITVGIRALLRRLNAHCNQALEAAAGACLTWTHYEVTVEHLFSALLQDTQNDVSLLLKHFKIDPVLAEGRVRAALETQKSGNAGKPVFSPLLLEWLQEAWLLGSVELNEPAIRSGALLLALASKPERFLAYPDVAAALEPMTRDALLDGFRTVVKPSIETKADSSSSAKTAATPPGGALDKFCTDFTRKAKAGEIDPVFGRDREIYQMIDILSRRRKNNPILVGEAGVGKTAVVEGLALRIINGSVPDALKDIAIVGLDMGLLQAGAGVQGEFENRLKSVIQEVKSSPAPVILFIDEAHTLIGAGGAAGTSDAANLLKPALARGELRTIAATTWAEYKKYFEKDAALARRFQPVKLEEPSVQDTILILRGLKSRYEKAHGVTVRDSAIIAAAEQSSRYISGRQQPDKAVDLLDTSAARVKVLLTAKPPVIDDREREAENLAREREGIERDAMHGEDPRRERVKAIDRRLKNLNQEIEALSERWQKEKAAAARLAAARQALYQEAATNDGKSRKALQAEADKIAKDLKSLQGPLPLLPTEVDSDVVAKVVSDWTGIPLGKVQRDQAETIQNLEFNLSKRIRGQSQAVAMICRALRASKSGLTNPDQPLGVFLLVGPSGVGKTETAMAAADLLFGGERFIVTVNMSEFQEAHSVSRLIGSPPGYVGFGEGGVLTEAVRQQPYSAVLIDETEKAHIDVMNLFYQVFDKGTLSDGEGRVIDFKNTALFLTSNLASEEILRLTSGLGSPDSEAVVSAIRPILSKHFKPALLARMTIVPYYALGPSHLREIVALKLGRLAERLMARHRVALAFDDAVWDAIVARCRDVETGARNIDHILNGTLLPLLSQEIVARMGEGRMPARMRLGVDANGAFAFIRNAAQEKPAAQALEMTQQG